jgi:hypothetical protein
VLEATRLTDYAIWGVALLLYAYDAARLLAPREMLLVERAKGRLGTALGDNPFTTGARTLALAPLHLPHRGAFVAGWGRAWSDETALAATLGSLTSLRASLNPLRVVAAVGAVLLFVVGPLLTAALGPNAAVVYTAAGVYPTVIAAAAALWWRRRGLRLTTTRATWLSLEMLVCPAFLPNLVRKITSHHPIEADGARVILATADAEDRDQLLAQLRRRTEDLLETDTTDPGGQGDLRAYLAVLRDAR